MTTAVREPAVSGLFYPAEPQKLAQSVGRLLDEARDRVSPPPREPKGLIVPHAGYAYSGPVAASGYVLLEPWRGRVERLVLLGTSHYGGIEGAVYCPCRSYRIPGAEFPADLDTLEALHRRGLARPHWPAHRREHSLEVQLPFVYQVLGRVPVVGLTVGRCSQEESAAVVEALWNGPETLLVLSTDLSHYLPYQQAQQTDRRTAQAITGLNPEVLSPHDACGFYALRGLLAVARSRGCTMQVVDLRNSGDTAGGRDEVVGYGSFVFWEPAQPPAAPTS